MKAFVRALVVVLCGTAAVAAGGPKSAVPDNPDEKVILHVLNRIGFGARPGDVERVRQIGLAKYIDQQLAPERIADNELASRLSGFETLNKSAREIAREYYLPAQMARQRAQLARKNPPPARSGAGETGESADAARPPRTPEEMELARKMRVNG